MEEFVSFLKGGERGGCVGVGGERRCGDSGCWAPPSPPPPPGLDGGPAGDLDSSCVGGASSKLGAGCMTP